MKVSCRNTAEEKTRRSRKIERTTEMSPANSWQERSQVSNKRGILSTRAAKVTRYAMPVAFSSKPAQNTSRARYVAMVNSFYSVLYQVVPTSSSRTDRNGTSVQNDDGSNRKQAPWHPFFRLDHSPWSFRDRPCLSLRHFALIASQIDSRNVGRLTAASSKATVVRKVTIGRGRECTASKTAVGKSRRAKRRFRPTSDYLIAARKIQSLRGHSDRSRIVIAKHLLDQLQSVFPGCQLDSLECEAL